MVRGTLAEGALCRDWGRESGDGVTRWLTLGRPTGGLHGNPGEQRRFPQARVAMRGKGELGFRQSDQADYAAELPVVRNCANDSS